MAAISFSLSRGTDENTLAAGSQTVTEGTSAPGAGDLELRIADPGTAAWSKREIEEAMGTIFRFLSDVNRSTTVIL